MSTAARPLCGCATSETTERFGKLLRLALIADRDGEIVAAVCALKRALTASGLDPHYIVDKAGRSSRMATHPARRGLRSPTAFGAGAAHAGAVEREGLRRLSEFCLVRCG
jgi:hypothetical protein